MQIENEAGIQLDCINEILVELNVLEERSLLLEITINEKTDLSENLKSQYLREKVSMDQKLKGIHLFIC